MARTTSGERDWDALVGHMDDEIREEVHGAMAPCTRDEFATAYAKLHKERHGEDWPSADLQGLLDRALADEARGGEVR